MTIDASARAAALGITPSFANLRPNGATLLPQRVAVFGQGATASTFSTDKRTVTSHAEVGSLYGFGSPLHLAVKQLLPDNGDGVGTIPVTVYPLDDAGGAAAATGSITPTGAATDNGTIYVKAGNIRSEAVGILSGDNVAAITAKITAAVNANIDMPVVAVDGTTDVDFTAKWQGTTGNDIVLAVEGTVAGVTFAAGTMSSGATDPDVDPSLLQVGDVWETLVVNCLSASDTTTLGKFATWNEGRWLALEHKPAIVFTGTTEATLTTLTTITDARKTDRTNSYLVNPGSDDLPWNVAARQVARIAVVANNNPARDYTTVAVDGLSQGADSDQWRYAVRDQALKAGVSSIRVINGVVSLDNTVTFYHPDGDPDPGYRYVVDIIKVQNIIYSLNLIFDQPEWAGAPLIPDAQPTANRSAKKPRMARAAVSSMIDNLALQALLSDPDTAKQTIVASINASNPKRLDISFTVQLSGNTGIIDIPFNFGFYFGALPVVA